ncbi:MAG: hypothetical protein K2Y19_09370 [Afipia birgiae]|jgi:hypothetical protein|nr:hypothetical protein [Afipia birgiae]
MSGTLESILPTDPEIMPVDVFVGATGYVVLVQEHTTPEAESYLRIRIRPDDAKALCMAITNAAREARKARKP